MIQHPSKSNNYLQKGFLDDVASETTSSVSHRLTRKQDENSGSRRSSKNSSESSLDGVDISKFYVKMASKEERISEPLRPVLIRRSTEVGPVKRRSPTPAHARRPKPEHPKRDENDQLEQEILMADLERKLGEERRAKEALERRLAGLEKELRVKLRRIDELERRSGELAAREEAMGLRLQEYQQMASISESNLNEARNSLEKLRGIIKKNRCQELELQNAKLKKQNISLVQDRNNFNNENATLKDLLTQLENELSILRMENENFVKGTRFREKDQEIEKLKLALSASKSEKEEELERLLVQKGEAEMRQRLRAEKLEIQVAYLNRKKSEEIEHLKTKHAQLLTKMRNNLCLLREQYSDLREEHDRLRARAAPQPHRRSLLLTDHRPTEDHFLFDLSP